MLPSKLLVEAVSEVTITTPGSGYTYAYINVNATEITGIGSPSTSAVLEVILPPSGGHGANVYKELGTKRVMINSRVQYDENQEFPVDTDFRRIGILRDPLEAGGGGLQVVQLTVLLLQLSFLLLLLHHLTLMK